MTALLQVEGLCVSVAHPGNSDPVSLLRDVRFALSPGETVGVLGASGSGKTTLALALMGLLPRDFTATGAVHFDGHELLSLSEGARRSLRARRISIVFQEPLTALNPRQRIGAQVAEVARAHGERNATRAHRLAVEMLSRTGLDDADERAHRFPHEVSGGERQRALLAMALLLDPALLIADEPTSALDVTVQAQVLQLLRAQQRERGMALLLVSHDLGVIATTCARTIVLHEGHVIEDTPTRQLLAAPEQPQSRALVDAVRPPEPAP
ncbi:MAG: ABC transporter ATP-binding protein [Gemmatimonadota bacterium]|nr:ABC transporter ATP-binding protein [Gemmatimonadota bacterium]